MITLPVLKTPTYTLTIPSTKKKTKYRPFLVREEKIMLLVKESNDASEMLNAMKDVIGSCTFGEVDTKELAIFDIEYIFMQLRARSVGENIEIPMRCVNMVADETGTMHECENKILFNIDTTKVEVEFPKDHTKIIVLDAEEGIGITFKYPSIETPLDINMNDEEYFNTIIDLVENIFDKNSVYDAKDMDRTQIVEFVDTLTHDQYKDINDKFFRSMPHLEHTEKYTCSKCGHEGSHTFKGISDFF